MQSHIWPACVVMASFLYCQADVSAQNAGNSGVLLIPNEFYEQIPTRGDSFRPSAHAMETVETTGLPESLSGVAASSEVLSGGESTSIPTPADVMYGAAPGIDQNWGPNASIVLPERIDLREYLPTPGKQSRNDCVAWAIAYSAYSCQIGQERRRRPTFASDQFSPKYVYDNLANSGGGLTVLQAVNFLKLNGCASRANLDLQNGQISSNAAVEANTFKLLDNARARNLDDIKLYLYEGYPVVLVVRMKADFRDDTALDASYLWTDDSSTDVNHHAVTAVGYDDQKNSLLLMNSWGTQWKSQGYCWASYDNFAAIDQRHWCAEAHVLKVKKSEPFDVWMSQQDTDAPANPFGPPTPVVWRHFSLKNDRKVYENAKVISPNSWKIDDLACNNKNLFFLARDQTVYQLKDDLSGVSWSHLSRSPLNNEKVCMMAAVGSQPLHVLTENQTLYQFEAETAKWSTVALPDDDLKPIDLRSIDNKLQVITDRGTVFRLKPDGPWNALKLIQP